MSSEFRQWLAKDPHCGRVGRDELAVGILMDHPLQHRFEQNPVAMFHARISVLLFSPPLQVSGISGSHYRLTGAHEKQLSGFE
jgi:hypothetical protein